MSGKVGVLGGCREYTGAPYFAAMAALKVRFSCDWLAHHVLLYHCSTSIRLCVSHVPARFTPSRREGVCSRQLQRQADGPRQRTKTGLSLSTMCVMEAAHEAQHSQAAVAACAMLHAISTSSHRLGATHHLLRAEKGHALMQHPLPQFLQRTLTVQHMSRARMHLAVASTPCLSHTMHACRWVLT